MKRDELRWIPKKPDCEGGRGFMTVGLQEVKPAVVFLLIGYGLSVLIIAAENLLRILNARYKKFKKTATKIKSKAKFDFSLE